MNPLPALLFLALPLHAAIPAGAKVPFITLEAEGQATTGKVLKLQGKPGTVVSPEIEASGRGYHRCGERLRRIHRQRHQRPAGRRKGDRQLRRR